MSCKGMKTIYRADKKCSSTLENNLSAHRQLGLVFSLLNRLFSKVEEHFLSARKMVSIPLQRG